MSKRSSKRCIFCGYQGRLSREHVWADWLKSVIPRDAPYNEHVVTTQGVSERGKLDGPGDPHSRRLRIVCKKCNETWMSKIQVETRPYLQPLAAGDWPDLDVTAQHCLAKWATMYTMVVEFSHPPTAKIPQIQRSLFQFSRTPPIGWVVFIAPYCEKGRFKSGSFNHFGWNIIGLNGAFSEIHDCQVTAFTVGCVAFFVWSSHPEAAGLLDPNSGDLFAINHGLTRIHPQVSHVVTRPSKQLDYTAFDLAANDRIRLLGLPYQIFVDHQNI